MVNLISDKYPGLEGQSNPITQQGVTILVPNVGPSKLAQGSRTSSVEYTGAENLRKASLGALFVHPKFVDYQTKFMGKLVTCNIKSTNGCEKRGISKSLIKPLANSLMFWKIEQRAK